MIHTVSSMYQNQRKAHAMLNIEHQLVHKQKKKKRKNGHDQFSALRLRYGKEGERARNM